VPNWAATHPPAADRVAKVQEAVRTATQPGATVTNEMELERQVDGIVYGDSREDGIIRGSEFLHPVLRFAVRFPPGWDVVNSAEQVSARPDENSNSAMLLELAPSNGGSPEQTARAVFSKAGFQELDGQRTRVNGLDAYIGRYQGVMSNQRVYMEAALIRADQQTYLVAGIAPTNEFNASSRAFSATIQSFRTLSRAEADRIQPDHVELYTVRAGDTWTSLARRGNSSVRPATLAIMNGVDAATPPRPGDRIRIVVGG
jgi:predicted Zn-dependent protease